MKQWTAPQAAYNYLSNANLTGDASITEQIYNFGEEPFPTDVDNLTTTFTPHNAIVRSQDTIYRLEIKDILRNHGWNNPDYTKNNIQMITIVIPSLLGVPVKQSKTEDVEPRVFGSSEYCRALLNTTDYYPSELKCEIDAT